MYKPLWEELGFWKSKKEIDDYVKQIKKEQKAAKNILIEDPKEVVSMHGLMMTEFEILSKPDEAYCANEEIYIGFQGKEMRIYINDEGKLAVYTD